MTAEEKVKVLREMLAHIRNVLDSLPDSALGTATVTDELGITRSLKAGTVRQLDEILELTE